MIEPYYHDERAEITIYCGDARSMATKNVSAGTVSLIFTDPPYPKEYHYLYEWLAKEAVRVLKPSGFLIAYAGPYWKQQVMEILGSQLEYFYDYILLHNGCTSILWPRRTITGYKSLLCYHLKGQKPVPVTNVLGKFKGTGSDKRFHHWGQEVNSARYYIDVFSRKDDLVIDYFLGGGTTAEVCKRLGRRFIGFEIDTASYEIARSRVEGCMSPENVRQAVMDFTRVRD
jgi:DNA modification methylase